MRRLRSNLRVHCGMTSLTMAPSLQGSSGFASRTRPDAEAPVVFYRCCDGAHPKSHEIASKASIAKAVAEFMGRRYAGDFVDGEDYGGSTPYFVPDDTLIVEPHAQKLGIHGVQQLFGGVVPFPFVATKAISHPLPDPDAVAPEGWAPGFAQEVAEVVLPGLSAFSRHDALRAGVLLLESGAVRLKRPNGVGGRGQSVVRDRRALESELAAIDSEELARDGIVLECNLADVRTFSVGQARIGDILISYCGTQQLTRANDGKQVYGGSELLVARGDWDDLLALGLAPQTRIAIGQARVYHDAALAAFSGMFASRSNYDVAQGVDDAGMRRSGVLEQSWRIGGATGAEIAAFRTFKEDPTRQSVRASTTEVYGEHPEIPEDAVIHYQGTDERAGPITKYARIHPNGDS